MKLDKRDVLRKISTIAVKLRCDPESFLSIEGVPDTDASSIRLNRLGKCLEMMCYLIEKCRDGEELDGHGITVYNEYIRYLKECHDAFDIGKKVD